MHAVGSKAKAGSFGHEARSKKGSLAFVRRLQAY